MPTDTGLPLSIDPDPVQGLFFIGVCSFRLDGTDDRVRQLCYRTAAAVA